MRVRPRVKFQCFIFKSKPLTLSWKKYNKLKSKIIKLDRKHVQALHFSTESTLDQNIYCGCPVKKIATSSL